jgi:hypothetical protein
MPNKGENKTSLSNIYRGLTFNIITNVLKSSTLQTVSLFGTLSGWEK